MERLKPFSRAWLQSGSFTVKGMERSLINCCSAKSLNKNWTRLGVSCLEECTERVIDSASSILKDIHFVFLYSLTTVEGTCLFFKNEYNEENQWKRNKERIYVHDNTLWNTYQYYEYTKMHLRYNDSLDDDKQDLNGFLTLLLSILHDNRILEELEYDLMIWLLTKQFLKILLLLLENKKKMQKRNTYCSICW